MLEPNAAGIDIGAREIFAAVPPDRDAHPVRVCATFTEDLQQLADWLRSLRSILLGVLNAVRQPLLAEDAEETLDEVHPGNMRGRVVKANNFRRWQRQKSLRKSRRRFNRCYLTAFSLETRTLGPR
jgi:hypothetical protein